MELVDILCLQANIFLVSFNFEITSLLFLFHSRLASILCQTCGVPLNHHNSNHIKLSISIIHNHYFHQLLRWRGLMSSSHYPGETTIRIDSYLAGELFLIHTILPPSRSHRVTFGTTQVQIVGKTNAVPSKILPIYQEARDSNPPLDSCHSLSAHPYCL